MVDWRDVGDAVPYGMYFSAQHNCADRQEADPYGGYFSSDHDLRREQAPALRGWGEVGAVDDWRDVGDAVPYGGGFGSMRSNSGAPGSSRPTKVPQRWCGAKNFTEGIMAFDFKKEYKEFYMPKSRPEIVNVPRASYIAVRGKGDPNEENGAYQKAMGVLYSVAYTLKMSYKTDHRIEGFFEYVVPPLEGFWWQDGVDGVDYTDKSAFNWISVIRLPDFVTRADFDWAVETASRKKKLDCSCAEYLTIDEGLCVQIMHLGAYDDEPETVAVMDAYLSENGYANDFGSGRLHHEIYLSDARKTAPEKLKTVIRHPVKKLG